MTLTAVRIPCYTELLLLNQPATGRDKFGILITKLLCSMGWCQGERGKKLILIEIANLYHVGSFAQENIHINFSYKKKSMAHHSTML